MQTRFILGADLSLLQHLNDHEVEYRQAGQADDLLHLFQRCGGNYVRLRLFLAPNGLEGQVNTLSYTLTLARRLKAAGLPFLLDFHYSDGWADPLHQDTPAEWHGLSLPALAERLRTYTYETLAAFRREGCLPDMVEVGNEITNGMLWPTAGPLSPPDAWNETRDPQPTQEEHEAKWDALCTLLQAGIQAVRDTSAGVKVMLHIDKGGSRAVSRWFFDAVRARGVEFDIIGLSYYPFWHGTLSDLEDTLAFLAETYGKEIAVVETGYDTGGGPQNDLPFPLTPDGQKNFLQALLRIVAATPGGRGIGVFYWQPEWIAGKTWNGPDWSVHWEQRALFSPTGEALPAWDAYRMHAAGEK